MAALTRFDGVQEALRKMDAATYRAVGWAFMFQTARQQVGLGLPVVLDALARDEDVRAVRGLGVELSVPSAVVVLRCDDEELQRMRVEKRSRRIPGWHELTWEDVARTRKQWNEPADVDLVLDSTQDLDAIVDAVVAHVHRLHNDTR
jgi:hypothetical protein